MVVFLLALGPLLPACERQAARPQAATIPPATFARVVADLSAARVEILPDTAGYRQRRTEILQRAGVTEDDLRVFVARRGGDDDLMSEIYGRIGARLDSVAQR
ncbi:MAG TPA: hypothetical protein VJP59_10565 [Gemmatimonadota bacterium]|nr:hypothetical protein [Gemmatimonadota bacterium]